MQAQFSMTSRLFALLLAAIALAALRAQYDVLPYGPGADSLWQRLWVLAGYFTVLTNVGVTIAMLAVAKKWQMSGAFAAGLMVSIVMVGIVYHLVLADLWNPVGLAWWANQGLHTAVPMGMAAWWLAFAPKSMTRLDIPKSLIWPMLFCVYAVIRGAMTGFWPYPFLDVVHLGSVRVALNIGGLIMAFGMLATGVYYLAQILRQNDQSKPI